MFLSSSVMSGPHVCRHFRLWQIQASQKSQMAPTSAMPVAFLPPCGTQQSLPRHLRISTIEALLCRRLQCFESEREHSDCVEQSHCILPSRIGELMQLHDDCMVELDSLGGATLSADGQPLNSITEVTEGSVALLC